MKKTRLLQLLPILKKPWQFFFMDFIRGFHNVQGYKSIIMVVTSYLNMQFLYPQHMSVLLNK